MGLRVKIYVVKHSSDRLRSLIEDAASSLGAMFFWASGETSLGADARTASNREVHTLAVEGPTQEVEALAMRIGANSDHPWLSTRISDGAIWEYSFYEHTTCIDRFSVAPEYWEVNDPQFSQDRRGNARLLSEKWPIDRERIENYLRNWQLTVVDEDTFEFGLGGKAYPTDRSEYGNPEQLFDFLSALGARDPFNLHEGAIQHRVHFG